MPTTKSEARQSLHCDMCGGTGFTCPSGPSDAPLEPCAKCSGRRYSALVAENAKLKAAVMNQRGDDLCWITDTAAAQALPESEFLESCRRYRAQIAGERGELSAGQMTIAQLESANVQLAEQVKTLWDALLAYVGLCGNTADMVDRVGLGQAYQMATAALDGTKEPA